MPPTPGRAWRAGGQKTYREVVVTDIPYRIALIVGVGSGISASFARGLAAAGLRVGLAARNIDKLTPLASGRG